MPNTNGSEKKTTEKQVSVKKTSFLRRKGLLTLLILFISIILCSILLSDKFIEHRLESRLSLGVGAKVEIDNFSFSLIGLNVGWKRLQITDPENTKKNLIETGVAEFDLAVEPLFYGKVVIDKIKLENLQNGTERESDGSLSKSQKAESEKPGILDEAAQNISKELSGSTGIDFSRMDGKIDINGVIDALEIKTFSRMNELKNSVNSKAAGWENEFKALSGIKDKADEIKNKAGSLKFENLNNVSGFIQSANTLKAVRAEILSLKTEFEDKKTAFAGDVNLLKSGISSIDDWIKEDIKTAGSKANLPDFDAKNIAGMLFGEKIKEYINDGFKYFDLARNYYEKFSPASKVESPERFTGQDISFRNDKAWPGFWLKHISVSGLTTSAEKSNGIFLSGNIFDISSNQKKTGKPSVINLSGGKTNGRSYDLKMLLDYTADNSTEEVSVNISGISLNNTSLWNNSLLPEGISRGTLDVLSNVLISNGEINGNIKFTGETLNFIFNSSKKLSLINKITEEVFKEAEKINVNISFKGKPDGLKLSIASNLDNIFSQKLKSALGREFEKQKNELEHKVRQKIEPEKQKAVSFLRSHMNNLTGRLSGTESLISADLDIINTKKLELEKQIDNVKNPLLKQALKAVKKTLKW